MNSLGTGVIPWVYVQACSRIFTYFRHWFWKFGKTCNISCTCSMGWERESVCMGVILLKQTITTSKYGEHKGMQNAIPVKKVSSFTSGPFLMPTDTPPTHTIIESTKTCWEAGSSYGLLYTLTWLSAQKS